MKAVVVFSDTGVGFLSRFLKPGFKHCYLLLDDGKFWVMLDALAGLPTLKVVANSSEDIARWAAERGEITLEVEQFSKPPSSPFAVANCVGLVKAMLAIKSFSITPYGLYKHLLRSGE